MACTINVFQHPELAPSIPGLIRGLEMQQKLFKGFELAKSLVGKSLSSNKLGRCLVFVQAINSRDSDNFCSEVQKLSLEELIFCSISFDNRQMPLIRESFKALHIRQYMKSQNVTCINQHDIRRRLDFYQKKYPEFGTYYESIKAADECPENNSTSSKPTSTESVRYWNFHAAAPQNLIHVIGETVASGLPLKEDHLWGGVRTELPRAVLPGQEDGIITVEVGSEGEWLRKLFPGTGLGADVGVFYDVFPPNICHQVDTCTQREWEKRNGFIEWTDCVTLTYAIKIRINNDIPLVNFLHQIDDLP